MIASSEVATREGMDHTGAECALDARVLVLALVHARECSHEYVEGGAQSLHRKQNSCKIETTDSSLAYDTFLWMLVSLLSEEKQ